jgi:hypothetical protein
MDAVGIERRESREATATDALQYPRRYNVRGTVHELERDRGPAARAVRCTIMDVVGIEIRESRRVTATDALQYPRRYSVHGTVYELEGDRGPAARAVRCAGNAERRFFLLISCSIRLIHLLSLYREEVFLSP